MTRLSAAIEWIRYADMSRQFLDADLMVPMSIGQLTADARNAYDAAGRLDTSRKIPRPAPVQRAAPARTDKEMASNV